MKQISALKHFAAALTLALLTSAGIASAQANGDAAAAKVRKLEGTWRVQVTIYDCATGAPNPPFHSFLSFAAGGTMTGTTDNPAFLAGQRSPDHGIWNSTGIGALSSESEAFILFDSQPHGPFPGFTTGTQRLAQQITMTSANDFSSLATIQFFDVNGNTLTTGCATATGARFE